jgi:hypothetical protein
LLANLSLNNINLPNKNIPGNVPSPITIIISIPLIGLNIDDALIKKAYIIGHGINPLNIPVNNDPNIDADLAD